MLVSIYFIEEASMAKLTLETVMNNFTKWRSKGSSKGKIPEYLWKQVLILLENYPATRVTSALSLSSSQVSKRRREHKGEKPTNIKSNFVEIPIPKPNHKAINISSSLGSRIEIKRPDGAMVAIEHLPEQVLTQILTKFMQVI